MVVAWRGLRGLSGREALLAVALAATTAVLVYAGAAKTGSPLAGVLAPLAVVLVVIALRSAVASTAIVFLLAVLFEGPTFGYLHFTAHLYEQVYKGMAPLDMLVAVAIVAVGLDLLRHRRPLQVPRPLIPACVTLLLGMVAALVMGRAAGGSLRSVAVSEHVLGYLLLLPIAVANLRLDRRQLAVMIAAVVALSLFKALFGLFEVASGRGDVVEGGTTLTYYEPAANWLIMMGLLVILAAASARTRPPRWMLLGVPLLLVALVLSYRRSFWIAAALAVMLVVMLGLSPAGRRILVPSVILIAAAIWLLGAVSVESQAPIVKRVETLTPERLEMNPEASYRLDERTNVLGVIGEHPITGIGISVPWTAGFRVLSVEHEHGREYVHFAGLWFWLKLGILGLAAYISFLGGGLVLAWQAWRRSHEPLLRAFGLASVCGLVGLAAIETTASFTGVDPRMTVLVAMQVGVLAIVVRTVPDVPQAPEGTASDAPAGAMPTSSVPSGSSRAPRRAQPLSAGG